MAALPSAADAPTGRLLAGRRPPNAAGKRKCRRGTCSLLAWRVAATPCFSFGTSDAPAAPAALGGRHRRPRNRACRVAAAPCRSLDGVCR